MQKLLSKNDQVQARMTVNPNNYMYLSDGVIELIQMGFKQILPIPDIFTKEWQFKMFEMFEDELKKVMQYLKKNNMEQEVSVGLIDNVECKTKNVLCDGGITTFSINTDGKIYPCMLVNGNPEYCIGDVFNGILKEKFDYVHKWDSQELKSCEGCTRYDYCTNTRCKIINHAIEGNALSPIVARCAVENMCVNLYEYSKNL